MRSAKARVSMFFSWLKYRIWHTEVGEVTIYRAIASWDNFGTKQPSPCFRPT